MNPVILHYDQKKKEVNLLSNLSYTIESTWTNCELVPKTKTVINVISSEEIVSYHILDIDLNYTVVASFPFGITIVFYELPKKSFSFDDIDWNEGSGY